MEPLDRRFDGRAIGDAGRIVVAGQARDERLEALEALLVQAPQFDDGLRVVVHAQVERRIRSVV